MGVNNPQEVIMIILIIQKVVHNQKIKLIEKALISKANFKH